MKIKGMIFDLDGTILDTMYIWRTASINYLKASGIDISDETYNKLRQMTTKDQMDFLTGEYGMAQSVEEIRAGMYKAMGVSYHNDEIENKPDIADFLEDMYNSGVKMAIATASEREFIEKPLEEKGLLKYFSTIITCTEVGEGKHTSLVYDKAMEFLGTTKDDTLIFEDAVYAVRTCKNAGYKVVGIEDDSAAKDRDEIKKLADYYITTYKNYKEDIKVLAD